MEIYRVVASVVDPCGENGGLDFIKDCKTLEGAYARVMEWADEWLKPEHNHLVKVDDYHYRIWANHETGPDDIHSCHIEKDTLED